MEDNYGYFLSIGNWNYRSIFCFDFQNVHPEASLIGLHACTVFRNNRIDEFCPCQQL